MGRKLLISILGTGFYGSCKYTKDGFVSSDTRFIQLATLELIKAKEWRKEDSVTILLTENAKKTNWNRTILVRKNYRTGTDEPYEGLQKSLEDMKMLCGIHALSIPDGKNEEEMWQIFEILFNELQDGDELYFDLTHSFRYLPMLLLVLGNYAKFLKNVSVKHISYGNYEARNVETNEAPIVDLFPLSLLQDWTFAAANYLQNGDISFLNTLCINSLTPILMDTEKRGNTPSAGVLKNYVHSLQVIAESMKGCRGIDIINGGNIKKASGLSRQLSEIIIPPLQPIIKKIQNTFDEFTPSEEILNGYRAAKWCYEHQLYQQALTILHENIVSHVCKERGIDYKNKRYRGAVNKAFAVLEMDENAWVVENEEERVLIKELLAMNLVRDLQSTFLITTTLRNDYNHAGMRDNPVKVCKFSNALKERIDKIYTMFLRDEIVVD